MKTKYCENPDCKKPMTRTNHVCESERERRYQRKKYCGTACANRHRSLKAQTPFPLSFCEVCGDEITRVSKNGNLLSKANYLRKATCGKRSCYRARFQTTTEKKQAQKRGERAGKPFYREPDLIEKWYLGQKPGGTGPIAVDPEGTGPIAIEQLKSMMNDLINPRLAA